MGSEPLGDRIGVAPALVSAWIPRSPRPAEGLDVELAVCDAPSSRVVVERKRSGSGAWEIPTG